MRPDIARLAAAYLRQQLDLTQDQEEIAAYGIQLLLYPLLDFALICLVGWLLGCLGATVIAALSTALVRFFSHGAHSKSPVICALIGMIIFPVLGRLALTGAPYFTGIALSSIILLGFTVSIIIVWRLSPVDSPAKPVSSSEERRKLRIHSLVAVVFISALQGALLLWTARAAAVVLAMSFGLWWQAFSLTGPGHRLAAKLDKTIAGKEGNPSEASNL